MSGKVVVNRCMSLDGFIAGPGHSMDWADGRALADFVAPDDLAEIAAATGAMLVGRRTWEVGDRMETEKPGSVDYPFSGPMFLLTHRPLERPAPEVRMLSGDIGGPTFGLYEYGVQPWEDWDLYRRHSPLTYAANVSTPLLIQHSARDLRCTITQAEELCALLR